MFMKDEIYGLKYLFDEVDDVQLDSFLTEEDIATIDYEADQLQNKNFLA